MSETLILQGFSDIEKARQLQYQWYHNYRANMVEVTGLEPAASCSQSKRATNCATPRYRGVNPHSPPLHCTINPTASQELTAIYTGRTGGAGTTGDKKPRFLSPLTCAVCYSMI